MGVQRLYVPHLKALISGKVELKGQGLGSTITLCHPQTKDHFTPKNRDCPDIYLPQCRPCIQCIELLLLSKSKENVVHFLEKHRQLLG